MTLADLTAIMWCVSALVWLCGVKVSHDGMRSAERIRDGFDPSSMSRAVYVERVRLWRERRQFNLYCAIGSALLALCAFERAAQGGAS